MLTPAFVDIPANDTGIVTVRCQTLVASINGAMYAGGSERGANDADGRIEVTIIPKSTELG